jgi:(2Fe-2S) ferredoxin
VAAHYRITVCKGPNCTYNGAEAVAAALRSAIEQRGLTGVCELTRGGCYGLCAFGPNVILRPQDHGSIRDPLDTGDFMLLGSPGEKHYSAMAPDKADRLIEAEIVRGEPVPEWLHINRAKSVLPVNRRSVQELPTGEERRKG